MESMSRGISVKRGMDVFWTCHGGARPIFWLKKEIWFDILKWREES